MKMRDLARDEMQRLMLPPELIESFSAFYEKTDPVDAATEVQPENEQAARATIRFALSIPNDQLDNVAAEALRIAQQITEKN